MNFCLFREKTAWCAIWKNAGQDRLLQRQAVREILAGPHGNKEGEVLRAGKTGFVTGKGSII